MYNIGDLVIYSTHGICRIDDICKKTYSGITRTYYVLHPIEDHSLTINTPVDNKNLGIMQGIINRNEAEEILQSFKLPGISWIEKSHDRNKIYTDIIKTGTSKEISKVINTLMRKKAEDESNGKKLAESDKQILILTQNILFKELSIALNTTFEAIAQEVHKILNIKFNS
ncbi:MULTISPECIES: CarD family transcriptional regulator [Bacillus]|uniref:CarD family transcriptional regulator n=1 Tax=Bacillus TaxID=1386 RepID=UPI0002E12965|nr:MULTISPECIES: CarD family transcriptional regulator [Bacillus]